MGSEMCIRDSLKNAKKITLVLWASSPVFWKTRMKDGGLRIDDEGKRIRDQSSPFHRQRKISSRTRNTKLDTEVWGKDQKTLQLGWTQQGRARSKYRKTTLIDKHHKDRNTKVESQAHCGTL